MDVLSEILGTLDLRGTLYFSTEFRPPWGVRVPRFERVARFHLNLRGDCWVGVEGSEPVLLESGDLVLVPHGAEHTLAGTPDAVCLSVDEVVERAGFTGRGALVYSGQIGSDEPASEGDDLPGADRGNPTRLVCGHFSFDESGAHPLLDQLPPMVVIRHDDAASASRLELEEIFRIITREVRAARPGSDAVVHRLSEVLFIQSVRVWAHGQDNDHQGHDQGLMTALLDPNLGASLEAFHERPGHRWTVEELALAGGLSRTVFSERFREVVGLSPMQYVTFWRLQTARKLLHTKHLPLDAVAQRVGYDSTAAFSRAFKKQVGQSPGAYRRAG